MSHKPRHPRTVRRKTGFEDCIRMSEMLNLVCDRGAGFDLNKAFAALMTGDTDSKEEVALWLRDEFKKIRESKPGNTLSRIEIADLAMSMIESWLLVVNKWRHPRPDASDVNLLGLLRELLDVDRHRAAFADQLHCAMVEAMAAHEGVRLSDGELARRVGVSRVTVLHWRGRSAIYKRRKDYAERAKKVISSWEDTPPPDDL